MISLAGHLILAAYGLAVAGGIARAMRRRPVPPVRDSLDEGYRSWRALYEATGDTEALGRMLEYVRGD
jgi:hypothetical protein